MSQTLLCANPSCGATLRLESVARLESRIVCSKCKQSMMIELPAETAALDEKSAPNAPAETTSLPDQGVGSEALSQHSSELLQKSIGRFQIRRFLGEGAFGAVYEGYDPQLDRAVAIKVAKLGSGDSSQRVKRFLREAKAAAGLRHPHIVPVYEFGQDRDQFYIVSAFIRGRTLHESMREQKSKCERPDLTRASRIVRQLAEALAYAHGLGIVHRDVKPANVMLDDKDEPMLMDFGLATRQEEAEKLTHAGAILGTPLYMAPEQALGHEGGVVAASDQYSLGVMLFEMITGQPPFTGTPEIVMVHHVEQEPPRPSKLNPAVNRDLETICLKCLEKEPGKRYASEAGLAEDLRRWQEGEPIKARRASAIERLVKWSRRNRGVAALTGLVAALLIVGSFVAWGLAGWAFTEARNAKEKEAEATQQKIEANKQTEAARDNLWRTLVEQARAERLSGNRQRSLDAIGEALKIKGGDELREEAIKAIASPGLRLLHKIPVGEIASMKFSPDGSILAVHGIFGNDKSMHIGKKPVPGDFLLKTWRMPSGTPLCEVALKSSSYRGEYQVSSFACTDWLDMDRRISPFFFAPKNSTLALIQSQNNVQIWDPVTGKILGELLTKRRVDEGFDDGMTGRPFAFDPTGETAFWSRAIWSLRDFRPLKKDIPDSAFSAFVTPEEIILADLSFRRVNLSTRKETQTSPKEWYPLAISANGHFAALTKLVTSADHPVQIWDTIAGKHAANLPNIRFDPEIGVRSHYGWQFSADGNRLAFEDAEYPKSVQIWDRSMGRIIAQLGGAIYGEGSSPRMTQHGSFSPDGSLFACYAHRDVPTLQLWDLDNHRLSSIIKDNHSPVWSEDGRFLATIGPGVLARPDGSKFGIDRTFLNVWEVAYSTPRRNIGFPVETLSFDPDGGRLAANSVIFEFPKNQKVLLQSSQRMDANVTGFLRNGDLWTAKYPTSVLDSWNPLLLSRRAVDRTTTDSILPLQDFRISRKESYYDENSRIRMSLQSVALAGSGASMAMPLLAPAMIFQKAPRMVAGRDQIAWQSKDGPVFIGTRGVRSEFHSLETPHRASFDLWEQIGSTPTKKWGFVRDFLPVIRFNGKNWLETNPRIPSWQISADGKLLAIADIERTKQGAIGPAIDILRMADGITIQRLRPSSHPKKKGDNWNFALPTCVLFDRDGSHVYSASECGRIHKVNVATGLELLSWQAHQESAISALALSPDGRLLASGGEDRSIRLWDTVTQKELIAWNFHDSMITGLTFSPDGQKLASGDHDGDVMLWDIPLFRRELAALGLDWHRE